MFWIRSYAFFWMCFCAYGTFRLLRKGTSDGDGEPSGEELVRSLDMLRAVLSPRAIMGMAVALCLVLVAIDAAGFVLVYTYPTLRVWELGVFLLAVAAALYDHAIGARFIMRGVRKVVFSDKPHDVLVRYIDRYKPPRNWKGYCASYGKLITALYGTLWACFG